MSSKREWIFPELNTCKRIPNRRSNENGILASSPHDPKDENMNEWLHGSQFSIHSAPVLESLSSEEHNVLSSKRSLPIGEKDNPLTCLDAQSDILPTWTIQDEAKTKSQKAQEPTDSDQYVRPCSLVLPTFNLTAVANEAQLRQCPILVKDLSYDTVDDDDNENHLTISSLTARPLIAKSHELRTKKIARKLREAERRACVRRFKPPDGGYGWAVVVGAFLVQFWVSGLVKSYGVMFVEVMEAFTDTSTAVAAWIPAILSTLCLALGESTERKMHRIARHEYVTISIVTLESCQENGFPFAHVSVTTFPCRANLELSRM